jgi:hypothetical protein
MTKTNYNDQVFINCPFGDEFQDMFHAFCFAVIDCGFIPRCSLEIDDATQSRLNAIIYLIEQCRYGIHDISRVELDEHLKLPRFNMPFELGIFYSAKVFGKKYQRMKNCIILEKDRYRYQKFISDISGVDVTPHGNSVKKSIIAIRNWLITSSKRTTIPHGIETYKKYLKFRRNIKRICKNKGVDFKTMPFVELTRNMTDWLKVNQKQPEPLF